MEASSTHIYTNSSLVACMVINGSLILQEIIIHNRDWRLEKETGASETRRDLLRVCIQVGRSRGSNSKSPSNRPDGDLVNRANLNSAGDECDDWWQVVMIRTQGNVLVVRECWWSLVNMWQYHWDTVIYFFYNFELLFYNFYFHFKFS